MKRYNIRKFAELIDVTPQTLRNWDKLGKLKPDYVNPDTGYRYYSEEQLEEQLSKANKDKIVVGYCRVSSKKQQSDLERQVSKIIVLYKDRLVRFGFDLIETICNENNVTIEVIDNSEKSEQEEIVEDLVQIITVFSCRLQGRSSKKTKELLKELTQND